MAVDLNTAYRHTGTRFRVYPQAPVLSSIAEPETIWVSQRPGSVGPGPSDAQMYVRDALYKTEPYESPDLPPYRGQIYAPVQPDSQGHFDYIPQNIREFEAAHMYAVIRRVLDVWELYFGHPISWHFDDRLELIPFIDWDNAQSGFGFIETGYRENAQQKPQLFCLNFDVLAHEIGHSIIYSEVGMPTSGTDASQYQGFQESAADMTALIAVLHFNSVVDRIMFDTHGNLYALNELNRIAEMSEVEQLRVASNDRRMSHYAAGWEKPHHLSQPLTGALFDCFVAIYHEFLIERQLISPALAEAAFEIVLSTGNEAEVQRRFDAAYQGRQHDFKLALLSARDYLGTILAESWTQLTAHNLTYTDVGHALLDADLELGHARFQSEIFECFRWREIGTVQPGPKLDKGSAEGSSEFL